MGLIELLVYGTIEVREDEIAQLAQRLLDTVPDPQQKGISIDLLKSILNRTISDADLAAVIAGEKRA